MPSCWRCSWGLCRLCGARRSRLGLRLFRLRLLWLHVDLRCRLGSLLGSRLDRFRGLDGLNGLGRRHRILLDDRRNRPGDFGSNGCGRLLGRLGSLCRNGNILGIGRDRRRCNGHDRLGDRSTLFSGRSTLPRRCTPAPASARLRRTPRVRRLLRLHGSLRRIRRPRIRPGVHSIRPGLGIAPGPGFGTLLGIRSGLGTRPGLAPGRSPVRHGLSRCDRARRSPSRRGPAPGRAPCGALLQAVELVE